LFCIAERHHRLFVLLLLLTPVVAAADHGSGAAREVPDEYKTDVVCLESAAAKLESPEIAVLNFNMAHGRGTSMNQMLVGRKGIAANLDRIAAFLREADADVVALQEADAASRWSGKFDHVGYVNEQLGYACSIHGIHASGVMFNFGTALLSPVSMYDGVSYSFEPTPPTTTKGFVSTSLDWSDGPGARHQTVFLVSVHLDFSRKKVRAAQLDDLVAAIRESEYPVILMGDFNSEWKEGSVVKALVNDAGLVAYEPESQDLPTYKDKRLDWILISEELAFSEYTVLPEEISDHRAILARIVWRDTEQ